MFIFYVVFSQTGGEPEQELRQCIERCFGSLQNLQTQLSSAAVAVQGSGWAWLGYNRDHNRLQIAACPNQDPLQATTGRRKSHCEFIWDQFRILVDG